MLKKTILFHMILFMLSCGISKPIKKNANHVNVNNDSLKMEMAIKNTLIIIEKHQNLDTL